MSDVRVRFAPSPTGSLHVGSARTALYNFLYARHNGGTMVLRVEDTDLKRSTTAHDASIIRDLEWLGLKADEGPDVGGPFGPYRQSERGHLYEAGVQKLLADGHAYPCFCPQELLEEVKAQQQARGEMPKYDLRCTCLTPAEVEARLAAGEEAAIRFRVPEGSVTFDDLIHGPITFSSDVIGDFIIKRTDGGYSYNFAVVVDDAGMEITDVIRGEDHITNTARQMMLFEALGKPAPRYGHHSLILAPDGSKLSKRHGATSIGDFKGLGYLPGAIVNYLASCRRAGEVRPAGTRARIRHRPGFQEPCDLRYPEAQLAERLVYTRSRYGRAIRAHRPVSGGVRHRTGSCPTGRGD
jgi:glutamyl-tRNA synthetase